MYITPQLGTHRVLCLERLELTSQVGVSQSRGFGSWEVVTGCDLLPPPKEAPERDVFISPHPSVLSSLICIHLLSVFASHKFHVSFCLSVSALQRLLQAWHRFVWTRLRQPPQHHFHLLISSDALMKIPSCSYPWPLLW